MVSESVMDFLSKIEVLNEVSRLKLLKSGRNDTKARFERRLTVADSEVHYYSVDVQEFLSTGTLVFRFEIRGYELTIELTGLIEYLTKKLKGQVNYKNIRRYLDQAIDKSNIYINCSCPDFRYRFAYAASKKGYKSGTPEDRPSNITNPKLKGSACKHLLKLLNNKRWVRKYITLINLLLKLNPGTLDRLAGKS